MTGMLAIPVHVLGVAAGMRWTNHAVTDSGQEGECFAKSDWRCLIVGRTRVLVIRTSGLTTVV